MEEKRSVRESVAMQLPESSTSSSLPTRSTSTRSGKLLPVMEIFGPTIQGEGLLAGVKTHFIRLGGCGYRCSWCDTLYAVLPEQVKAGRRMMYPADIVAQLRAQAPARWVTLTGGDPAMHDLTDLLRELLAWDFMTCIETQGQFFKDWMRYIDVVTVSPKPPSSGMADKLDWKVLKQYRGAQKLCVKVVVFDDDDYVWAKNIFLGMESCGASFGDWYMTPGTSQLRGNDSILEAISRKTRWLYEKAAADPTFDDRIKIIPQLHAIAWGDRRGV
jgi:7-carboxy-7-deazaguanine synthase